MFPRFNSSIGVTNYKIPLYSNMGQMGGDYYPSGQSHGIYNKYTYTNNSYQGEWNYMALSRIPFSAMLDFPGLSKLTNNLFCHDSTWSIVPSKIPLNIPKFKVKNGEEH